MGASFSFAQVQPNSDEWINKEGQKVQRLTPSEFRITTPLSTWPIVSDEVSNEDRKKIRNFETTGRVWDSTIWDIDPVVQTKNGERVSRSPQINYQGLSGSGYPPDPSGAAGPNHYVQAVNTVFRVFNKSGQSVAGPFNLNSLWPGSSNLGDPIVMYDRHADRWFISQFKSNPNGILIAISTSNDPTGTYYQYSFNLSQFPDYPKYSIWWDGYYMTSNSTHTAVVFERAKMLAGDPTAQMISLSLPSLNSNGFRSPLPSDADGNLPPNGTPCYFFNLEDNSFGGVSTDRIKVWTMQVNWTAPQNTQITQTQTIPVDAFNSGFSGGFNNISQPGTTQKLDAIQGVFMYRAQHLRWTNYNTIVLSHAVNTGGNRSAIRWYELRDQNNGNWSVHQSGTFDPDQTGSRWMSSAAMDNFGNIGMAYSYCDAGSNTFAGLRYTGRLANDPLGEMTFFEQTAVEGTAAQKNTDRFGDYAHLALDPDGSTFWHTGEFIGGTVNGVPRTRIFSFNLAAEAGLKSPYYDDLDMKVYQKGQIWKIDIQGMVTKEEVQVDIISAFGQTVATKMNMQSVNGSLSTEFDVSTLSEGIYFVRLGNSNFQQVVKMRKD